MRYLSWALKLLLLAAVVFFLFKAGSSLIVTIATFLLILGLLVFVHELGHFMVAKRAGMQVEEFGFGFPPRMFGFKKGETIYSVNWIPLGGFVKIAGEDGGENDNPKAFSNKGFWARFAVLAAGVSMNVIFAWLIISVAMGIGIPTAIYEGESLPASAHVENSYVALTEITPDSPADVAGLKAGDTVLKVNNEPIDTTEELQNLTNQNLGKETTYSIKRGDEVMDKVITPRAQPPEGQGPLGVSLSLVAKVSYPWYQALYWGLGATWNLVYSTISAFVSVIGQWLSGHSVSSQLSGPVGIAVLTRDVAALGFIYLLQFTAILSVNLAVINAVPFPALDGGRILFLIIEKFRGKKLPATAEQIANSVGFFLLIALMVFVTVRDFGRFDIIERLKHLLS